LTLTAALVVFAVEPAHTVEVFNMPNGQTSLELVTVGDAGNAADTAAHSGNPAGQGALAYNYSIGKYEVTAAQYCQFLNAVAKSDPYWLYNSLMSNRTGIVRNGDVGNYTYTVASGHENFPVTNATWGSAARFCNWLQNGQPSSGVEDANTTENGAYNLNGATTDAALMAVSRNPGASYWIPTEDEWYKSAYYKGGSTNAGYWTFPTQSNTLPSNIFSATDTNNANYRLGSLYNPIYTDPTNFLTAVGAFAASPGPYGTYDQAGNAWEWNETAVHPTRRGMRGGCYVGDYTFLNANSRNDDSPTLTGCGFRVASIPEPASLAMLAGIALTALLYWWRKRA